MDSITIRPLDGQGWAVELSGVENAQHFRSGARAESAARRLAQRLADAGRQSEILIYLRDGVLGGHFVAPPR